MLLEAPDSSLPLAAPQRAEVWRTGARQATHYRLVPAVKDAFGDTVLAQDRADDKPAVAKRGNLVFVRRGTIYIISTELAERVIERSSYRKTTAEEDEILRLRLADILKKMEFTRPATDS